MTRTRPMGAAYGRIVQIYSKNWLELLRSFVPDVDFFSEM